MKQKGRPVRGAIAGFFFGLFLSLDLLILGLVATDADILAVLPLLGLLAGIALGLTAPLHRRASLASPVGSDGSPPAIGGPAPGPAAGGAPPGGERSPFNPGG